MTSSSPMAMECDSLSPVKSSAVTKNFMIIDTNVLLSKLDLLKEFIPLIFAIDLVIIIPMKVIDELDGLKKATGNYQLKHNNVSNLARSAIDFLLSLLREECKSIRGQLPEEFLKVYTDNDDRILDCCRSKEADNVFLFSSDKNLCLKAVTRGIRLLDNFQGNATDLLNHILTFIKKAKPLSIHTCNSSQGMTNARHINNLHSPNQLNFVGHHDMDLDTEPEPQVPLKRRSSNDEYHVGFSLVCLVESKLEKALCYHLKRFLGDEWTFVIRKRLPWDAIDMLYIVKHHWISVFSDVYPRLLLSSIEHAQRTVLLIKKGPMIAKLIKRNSIVELYGVVEMLFMASLDCESSEERSERRKLMEELRRILKM